MTTKRMEDKDCDWMYKNMVKLETLKQKQVGVLGDDGQKTLEVCYGDL